LSARDDDDHDDDDDGDSARARAAPRRILGHSGLSRRIPFPVLDAFHSDPNRIFHVINLPVARRTTRDSLLTTRLA